MKNNLNYIFLIAALFFLLPKNLYSQDPNFSQFYNNLTYYNPAMTAINGGYSFKTSGRSLWTPIPGKHNTYLSSFDAGVASIGNLMPGLGIILLSDVSGQASLRTTGGYLNLSLGYTAGKKNLFMFKVGGSFGLVNKSVDQSKFLFSDQLDEVYGIIHPSAFNSSLDSYNRLDNSIGGIIRFNLKQLKNNPIITKTMITSGLSCYHLGIKDAFLEDQFNLPFKLNFYTNIKMLIASTVLSPALLIERQNKFNTVTLGSEIINNPLSIGIWYRNKSLSHSIKQFDSFIMSVGYRIPLNGTISMRFTYSYDFTISQLATSSFGSHEGNLIIDFDQRLLFNKIKTKKDNQKMFQCPTEFN